MRVIRNKTNKPLRVPLPQGKVLHLGPRAEGRIADPAVDHEPLQKLVAAGEIEVLDESSALPAPGSRKGGSVDTHGHHPHDSVKKRGNR